MSVFLKIVSSKIVHTRETGCSILEAVEKEDIDKNSYENYLKSEREKAHFELTVVEKRKKDKEFGKTIKNHKKDKNSNKDKLDNANILSLNRHYVSRWRQIRQCGELCWIRTNDLCPVKAAL